MKRNYAYINLKVKKGKTTQLHKNLDQYRWS